jgi:hypothetical protein
MIDLVALPATQQCLTDKCMAQIVDTRLRVAAAGNPAQATTETVEEAMDGSLRNRSAIGCEEERLNP